MNFNSPEYIIFLPSVLLLHWLLPHKYRWALLLAASWLFYFSWEPVAGLLLVLTTLVSYLCAIGIGKAASKTAKRVMLITAIVFSLGVLAVFKYAGFFASAVGAELTLKILLPVGISFYTFQTLSYVIDVYRGKIPPERHFGYYALFVCFFPQLVAGPIERPDKLLPQLKGERKLKKELFSEGSVLLLRGCFKKTVIADFLAPIADGIFAAPESASGFGVICGAAIFGLQIYCDFSGYTDIARGSAKMLGIDLTENFRRPYSADSVRDFWRRWHITLTSWFTDYVYIPLGGSKKGRVRRIINTLIVFLLSGLWHGAGWGFVVWGLIHGIYLSFEIITDKKPGRIIMFILVSFAWIFFRAQSLGDAFALLSRIPAGWTQLALPGWLPGAAAAAAALAALERREKLSWIAAFGMLAAIIVAAMSELASGGGNAFIYFQF